MGLLTIRCSRPTTYSASAWTLAYGTQAAMNVRYWRFSAAAVRPSRSYARRSRPSASPRLQSLIQRRLTDAIATSSRSTAQSKLPRSSHSRAAAMKSTRHTLPGELAVDDQYLAAWKFVKGWRAGNAGLRLLRSKRLASSLRFGKRQSPALLPSERPHAPFARLFASDRAVDQPRITCKQFAFFNQTDHPVLHLFHNCSRKQERSLSSSNDGWRAGACCASRAMRPPQKPVTLCAQRQCEHTAVASLLATLRHCLRCGQRVARLDGARPNMRRRRSTP